MLYFDIWSTKTSEVCFALGQEFHEAIRSESLESLRDEMGDRQSFL